jgi:hypothetical protein
MSYFSSCFSNQVFTVNEEALLVIGFSQPEINFLVLYIIQHYLKILNEK